MRIALNFLGYTPGRGGVDTYLVNLVSALQQVDDVNDYLILCDPSAADEFTISRPNFKVRQLPVERPSFVWFVRGVFLHTVRLDFLTWLLGNLKVDVVHHPLTTLNPPGLPYPSVLTVHDLQHEYFPELFAPQELRRRRLEYPLSARQADSVIAISHHVKSCLVGCYDVSPEKIQVVHHGHSALFRRIESLEILEEVRRKYTLSRPFMIYPAATWAHKNHLRLLAAVSTLIKEGTFKGELLLTGLAKDGHDMVMNEIDRLNLTGTVRWLGYLPAADLAALYSMARLMVFPSLFEGFGLPVIEAMACGCPVAVANTTSLPEVAGNAAFYFDPTSVEEMSREIYSAWYEESHRKQQAAAGLNIARKFNWQRTARETLDVYQQAYRNRRA